MEIINIRKPHRVVLTSEAIVRVDEPTLYSEVVNFGLAALGETRSSLYGYGIRNSADGPIRDAVIEPGRYTVYAERD